MSLFSTAVLQNIDYIAGIGMLAILLAGAICDGICQEVPDSVTFSFAFIGILTALVHGRYVGAAIALLIVLSIFFGYQPKFVKRISDHFLKRAYKDAEVLEAENATINEASDSFFEKHGTKVSVVALILYAVTVIAMCIACLSDGLPIAKCVIAVGSFLAVSVGLVAMLFFTKQADDAEHEEISAFGGADSVFVVGILAYFGIVDGMYAITAMFLGIIVLYAIRTIAYKILKKESKLKGFPLLPYLTASSVLGVWAVQTFAGGVSSLFAEVMPFMRLI